MTSSGIDVNAFPPELPPQPDTDDLEPEAARTPQEATAPPPETPTTREAPAAAEDGPQWPPCEYCEGVSQLAIRYRSGGETEFSCFPCHGAVIARALNEAADQAEAVGQ